jgi:uncharacterized lipoprotein
MIKLKSVIYLISMMTLAGCSGQKQASVAVEEQSGQWILGPFVRPEGVNPVISPQPTTFQCPMRRMSGQLKPISGMLLKIKKKSWHAGS